MRELTRLLEINDVLDPLDAVLFDLFVLIDPHLFVLFSDGEEHEDGLDGLLDPAEAVSVEAVHVGKLVGRRVETERARPRIERLRVAVEARGEQAS